MSLFSIEILEQGWMEDLASEYDLCTHGRLLLTIGGVPITSPDDEYGISESALALLRTLPRDHVPNRDARFPERLILHGCGAILMIGCPIGVDFAVRHRDDVVLISDVLRYDTTSDTPTHTFPGLAVAIPEHAYQRAILDFAREARAPFEGANKLMADDFEALQHREFWDEYDALVAQFDVR